MSADLSTLLFDEKLSRLNVRIQNNMIVSVNQERILREVKETSQLTIALTSQLVISRSFVLELARTSRIISIHTSRALISEHRRTTSDFTYMTMNDFSIACSDSSQQLIEQVSFDSELSNIAEENLMQLEKEVSEKIKNKCTCSTNVKIE